MCGSSRACGPTSPSPSTPSAPRAGVASGRAAASCWRGGADSRPATPASSSTSLTPTWSTTRRVSSRPSVPSLSVSLPALTCSPGPQPSLAALCRTIPGDAPLYTLWRVDASSVRCPIQGPQLFSYDFGRGSCSSPMSSLESCTVTTRISFKYQACPNVPGTEMRGKTCSRTWCRTWCRT